MYQCSCRDEKTREVLKLVCDLYALDRIWKDIGTFRNLDYVTPNKAKVCVCLSHAFSRPYPNTTNVQYIFSFKTEPGPDDPLLCLQAIRKMVENLSYQVRLVAPELVDAFDIPDQIIRAPIGMQSEAYSQYTQCVGF